MLANFDSTYGRLRLLLGPFLQTSGVGWPQIGKLCTRPNLLVADRMDSDVKAGSKRGMLEVWIDVWCGSCQYSYDNNPEFGPWGREVTKDREWPQPRQRWA